MVFAAGVVPGVALLPLAEPLTLISDETFETPCVSRASAMARPTILALAAEPLRVTSPLFASTSINEVPTSWSACSLPLTMVSMTASSVLPVGAPTMLSFVRTTAVPASMSD